MTEGSGVPLVLLAEDDHDTREMYQEFLRLSGFRTALVQNARDALRVAGEQQPDVVILDLGLPDLDGVELCRRLKQNPATRHIGVIAVTGHGDDTLIQLAREAGVGSVLLKPCPPDVLLSALQRQLDVSGARMRD